MKIFGCALREVTPASAGPMELADITLVASPSELRRMPAFLPSAADLMEKHAHDYEHEHLAENQAGFDTSPQLAVSNPDVGGEG